MQKEMPERRCGKKMRKKMKMQKEMPGPELHPKKGIKKCPPRDSNPEPTT